MSTRREKQKIHHIAHVHGLNLRLLLFRRIYTDAELHGRRRRSVAGTWLHDLVRITWGTHVLRHPPSTCRSPDHTRHDYMYACCMDGQARGWLRLHRRYISEREKVKRSKETLAFRLRSLFPHLRAVRSQPGQSSVCESTASHLLLRARASMSSIRKILN